MLTDDRDYIFNADRENMLSVMKYNCDMVKQEQKPVIFHSENGKLYSYMATSRYETFDGTKGLYVFEFPITFYRPNQTIPFIIN